MEANNVKLHVVKAVLLSLLCIVIIFAAYYGVNKWITAPETETVDTPEEVFDNTETSNTQGEILISNLLNDSDKPDNSETPLTVLFNDATEASTVVFSQEYYDQRQLVLKSIQEENKKKRERKYLARITPLEAPGGFRDDIVETRRVDIEYPVDTEEPGDALIAISEGENNEGNNTGKNRLDRGSLIPAILQTNIDSNLPGLIKAQVKSNVYDSLTGNILLIPSGSKLLGAYGDDTEVGQKRLVVFWTSLIYPSGRIIEFEKVASVDEFGATGVKGKRTSPFLKTLLTAFFINAATTSFSADSDNEIADAIKGVATDSVGSVTEEYIKSVAPTGPRFRVPAGKSFNLILESDLWL